MIVPSRFKNIRWLSFLAVALLTTGVTLPRRDAIVLPEMLAIEMPRPGHAEIAPTETPLKELLDSATARGLTVTHDRTEPLPIGGTLVTWTAWESEPHKSPPRRSTSAYVYVFPFGHTPVGISGDDHATAGNHSAKVVRDKEGKIHLAWLDGGRAGQARRVLYRRGAQDYDTGKILWETEPLRVSEPRYEAGNSYVALAASENAIHFAWNGRGSSRYRRLIRKGADWHFEPIRSTRAEGEWHDNSPDLAVRGDDEIHVLTPTGNYAFSTDGGLSWKSDRVPRPAHTGIKNPALAVDAKGNAHIVFTGTVRNAASWSSSKPNRGYWQLRYVRREAGGRWLDAQDVLASFPRWSEPKDDSDMLSDWADIAVDSSGAIHLVWHGTVNTRIFGNDEAFYSHRPMKAEGTWGNWREPQALHPINPSKAEYFSFAPSLSIDEMNKSVVAVVFFDTTRGDHVLDVDARLIRNGTIDGPPIVVSRLARLLAIDGKSQNMSTWFPVVNPRVFRRPEGGAWLDVLSTVVPPTDHKSPNFILYNRVDLKESVKNPRR